MVTNEDIGAEYGRPWVTIPSCGQSAHLLPLVRSLTAAGTAVCVVINNMRSRDEMSLISQVVQAGGFVYVWPGQANIYAMWNWAIKQGRDHNCSSVSILNDDIEIEPESVMVMDMELECLEGLAILGWDYTDRTVPEPEIQQVNGSYRKGGVGGFAFMVKPHDVPYIDERFSWWGGDDDLFLGTAALGHNLGIFWGMKVIHHTSTTASQNPSVYDRCGEDRQLLLDKWGDTW